jgi:selenocysteine lyase/cysteine desulfurase
MTTELSRRGVLAGTPMSIAAAAAMTSAARADEPLPVSLEHLRPSGPTDDAYWLRVRREFNLRDRLIWLNTGTFGPSPRIVPETHARVAREQAEDPSGSARAKEREMVRAQIARFIGAKPEEALITRSTTEGVNIFAHGLDWRRGDEVVMATHEHPGGYGAYRTLAERLGITVKWVKLPAPPESAEQLVDLYRRAMTRKTRVLFVSHIMFVNGTVMPVRALADMAHSRGALISVDGAHSAGSLPIDVAALDCDHYAAAGQKWLMAGSGTGLSYIRHDLQPKIWPLMGWTEPEEKERLTSRKFEVTGQRNIPSIIGLGAAIAFQEAVGRDNIEVRVRALGRRLRAGLVTIPNVKLYTPQVPDLDAGITTFGIFDVGLTNENLAGALALRHGMRVSKQFDDKGPTKGWNSVRVCTHIFVMPDEVDMLVDAVREITAHPERYRDAKRPEEA